MKTNFLFPLFLIPFAVVGLHLSTLFNNLLIENGEKLLVSYITQRVQLTDMLALCREDN